MGERERMSVLPTYSIERPLLIGALHSPHLSCSPSDSYASVCRNPTRACRLSSFILD